MDFKALTYFAEIVRQGSITKAATQLRVTQPALSRQVRLLEQDLGVALLIRHRRGIELTDEGVNFARHGEALLRMAQNARDDLRARVTETSGTIRFGFLPSMGSLVVGQLVCEFMRMFPKVTFELREAYTPELRDSLVNDRIDLAIMSYEIDHPDLYREPLFAEDIWLAAVPSRWPFAGRNAKATKSLKPRQLADLPLLHAKYLRNSLDELSRREKIRLHSVIEADARDVMRIALRAGVGFLIAPACAILEEIQRGELVGAPVQGLEVQRGLFRRVDRPLSRTLLKFTEDFNNALTLLKKEGRFVLRDFEPSRRR